MIVAPTAHPLPIRFVGSGSEYFRIWIVNLLLTLVTVGLYLPFARARRLRYFYGSTEVAGRPLSFLGNPWKMFRGFLLVGLFVLVYGLASRASPLAAGVALLAFWGLWPGLWRSSLRFRLVNTGWSGLRGGFSGSTRGAYVAFWPFVLGGLGLVGALMLESAARPKLEAAVPLAGLALMLGLAPLGLWSLRRYQHGHYAFGDERARFSVAVWPVYRVALRALPLLVVGLLVPLAVVAGVAWTHRGSTNAQETAQVAALLPAVVLVLAFLVFQGVVRPYLTARWQNLFWNGTRSQRLQVDSRLRARSLIGLSLKNLLLVMVTLGLYLPFAAVAVARLQLESITLLSDVDPDALAASAAAGREAAAGDAAGDLLGVDIGL